ncbi:MAG TPA: VOC family protein, partial [Gemmatimonadaceae bacterium]|nr:VOC family protein [Gemmatimonadaceae bacterium]
MGATTNDIFGRSGGDEPATPGSFGQAPPGFRLSADTRVGPVRLEIADLGRSVDFYTGVLGLRVLDREGRRA